MSCASEIRNECGQATIEAAFVLPVLMILFLMLLQPGIVLYDHMIMTGAAAEGCRLLSTSSAADRDICEDYIRRRLAAIPQADLFHIHGSGCSYTVEFSGDESSESVTVKISNRLRPLPLMDITLSLAGITDASGSLLLSAESSASTQPLWVGESKDGRDPSGWASS